ncbi:glycoside hydrolase family 130 protein [Gorillibacterium sp. CAU 1737]|uniref:glycoside hydrolase family 130 protein n=1 Tax=Gorillibacterium sp. CAU 1737 TaxID=3140362 RepID=UPI00326137F9
MSVKMIGEALPNVPWQERPDNSSVIWRYSNNPIIPWNPTKKSARIYNSAVLPYEGGFIGVFRADHKNGRPQIHLGRSNDGFNWDIEDEEVHWVDEEGNPYQPNYAYDPRLVKIEDTYYIVWCTDFGGAALGLGRTTDFKTFIRMENPFIPFNRNGILFPKKIRDKYLLLSRPSDSGHTPFGDIFLSESPDLVHWGRHRRVMTRGGNGWWQGVKIGGGPNPIETNEGWLMIFHGVSGTCNGFVYSMSAALLDLEDPSKVLYRSGDYLLTPEESYETTGFVPNVAFPCATLHDPATGRIAIYYGAADTHVAVAFTEVNTLVDWIKEHNDLNPGDAESYR